MTLRWTLQAGLAAALGAIPVGLVLDSAPAIAGSASAIEPDEEAGREAYAEDCRACHSGAIAPTLKGVAGRKVASISGYSYSEALKAKAGQAWSDKNLDAFLADPRVFAPGTKMVKKVEDPQTRADLVAYLQSL